MSIPTYESTHMATVKSWTKIIVSYAVFQSEFSD